MATPLLIDTDVLIDYLRDYPAAVSYVEAQQERFLISVVTVAELYAGGPAASRLWRATGEWSGALPPTQQRGGPSGAPTRAWGPGCPLGAAGEPAADGDVRP
jgi:hypothetical protein